MFRPAAGTFIRFGLRSNEEVEIQPNVNSIVRLTRTSHWYIVPISNPESLIDVSGPSVDTLSR